MTPPTPADPRRGRGWSVVLLVVLVAAAVPVATATATQTDGDDVETISPGETVTGSVDELDPVRDNPQQNDHSGTWYFDPVTFEGESGDVVSLSAYADVDVSTVLIGPNGTRVAANEDGGPGQNAQIVARLPENGTYTLQVMSHYPEQTFDYVLSMEEYTGEYEEDPSSIGANESRVGFVDYRDARNLLRFNGYYDQIQYAGPTGENVTIEVSAAVDSAVYLVGDGGRIFAAEVASASGSDARLQTTVPQTGNFAVVVASGDDDPHFAYRVSVSETATEETEHDDATDHESPAGQHDHAHESAVRIGPDPQVIALATNRTTVTVGEPVRVNTTVANLGDESATINRTVAGQRVTDSLEPYSMGELTTTHTFERPGPRQIQVGNETATVHVLPPDGNAMRIDDSTVVGYVPAASADQRVTFAAGGSGLSVAALNVTPAAAGPLWVRAETHDGTPADVPAPPVGRTVGSVELTDGDGAMDGVGDTSVTVRVPDAGNESTVIALYGYDDDAGEWDRLPTRRSGEAGNTSTYRAPTRGTSLLAVGLTDDPVERWATVEHAGETTVTVGFENRGTVPADRPVTVSVDGRQVHDETVTVPPGETTRTTVALDPLEPGAHRIAVGEAVVGTVEVEATTTATPADTATTAEATPTPSETAETTATPTATRGEGTTSGTATSQGDGIGIAVAGGAIAVLLSVVGLRTRDGR